MSQKKITITEVAEEAGISVTTVSLVLSGKGRISAATADRVYQAIEKLGYVRNRSAAMLRGGDSGVVGLIVRDICNPFYAEMTAGLSETLEKHGKVLFLTQSGQQGQNLNRCFDSLVAQGVEGIVLGGGAANAADLSTRARDAGIALLCASRASSLEDTDSIRPDNLHAAQMATEYLIKRGHHCIAWLGGSGSSLTRAERIGGYCSSLLQYGLPFRSEWIIECGSQQRDAAELTEQLIHQHPTVTAILCHNASVALGCYFGLQRSGRTIGKGGLDSYFGQQMALVGFGDVPEAQLTDPPLTFITSSAREIGRSAGMRLLQRMADPQGDIQNVIMPPVLIERGSA
ncbi:Mal regulon transcriptional regulator MalI [Erwiniaceae bacterium BAC15a-03b]|uniref:Mal regulon transcriptional regulator MalI n=1 Tax=Winslowiella arboricola TaxID=2978220 RepID=A0A9J6Q0M3_9GAMM|nr:Mal regulon transcriptional regulator MalI [Winslowiella arboricola]MCU5772400.1 Mal regulon transcriptional regulator MalI [Winslowiella arboricola]MCU5779807.1 Mal regulon transcriptional regulator MalI [Winslowiella arboricola]